MSRQYNITGLNGLYLTVRPTVPVDSSNYLSEMIRNADFFPKANSNRSGGFLLSKPNSNHLFKNSQFNASAANVSGSNSLVTANSAITYSEITNQNQLILNETYYNKFIFHFNFNDAISNGYTPNSSVISANDFKQHLTKIRVKLYVLLGSNMVPLKLTNLEYYFNEGPGVTWNSAYSGVSPLFWEPNHKYGFRLNTGENNEDCIDVGLVVSDYFNPYISLISERMSGVDVEPGGYLYRCTAEIPDFSSICRGNKDYKLIVKYYNMKITDVTGVTVNTNTSPYNTNEAIEMMAHNYVWYEYIDQTVLAGGGAPTDPGPIIGP